MRRLEKLLDQLLAVQQSGVLMSALDAHSEDAADSNPAHFSTRGAQELAGSSYVLRCPSSMPSLYYILQALC